MNRAHFGWLVIFAVLIGNGRLVRITRFVVPKVVQLGAVVDFDCAYDLENDQLYDVKWYKDSEEFYRCKSNGEVQMFDVKGVRLYQSHTAILGSCPVSLTISSNTSAGQYHCEISTEGPEFKTTARSVDLKVDKSSSRPPSRRIQNDLSMDPNLKTSNVNNGTSKRKLITTSLIVTVLFYLMMKINVCYI